MVGLWFCSRSHLDELGSYWPLVELFWSNKYALFWLCSTINIRYSGIFFANDGALLLMCVPFGPLWSFAPIGGSFAPKYEALLLG